ncbi:hypothetical protein TWF281_008491 [Arthrobotrys megalospora]
MIECEGLCNVPPTGSDKDVVSNNIIPTTISIFLTTFFSLFFLFSFFFPSYLLHRPLQNRQFIISSKSKLVEKTFEATNRISLRKHDDDDDGSDDAGCVKPATFPSTKSTKPPLIPPENILLTYSLRGTRAVQSINRLPNPLAWVQSPWVKRKYVTISLHQRSPPNMDTHTEQPEQLPPPPPPPPPSPPPPPPPSPITTIVPTVCTCGKSVTNSKHSGSSQPWGALVYSQQKQSQRTTNIWDNFDDNDPWFPATRESEHRMMLLTFAEHILSRAKFLNYLGGTEKDRLRVISTIEEPFRAILQKLVADTTFPSPNRANFDSILHGPSYSAADISRALFHHKHHFTKCEWYIICVDWFQSWTGYSMSEALRNGVGEPEWERKWVMDSLPLLKDCEADAEGEVDTEKVKKAVQPKLRRRFRAFAYWEEGYEGAAFG